MSGPLDPPNEPPTPCPPQDGEAHCERCGARLELDGWCREPGCHGWDACPGCGQVGECHPSCPESADEEPREWEPS